MSLKEDEMSGYIVSTDSDGFTRFTDLIWVSSTTTSISTGLEARTMEEV